MIHFPQAFAARRPVLERLCNYHLDTGLRRRSPSNTGQQAIKKPGLNKGSAGITCVPGLFSELFNVAASRPAQMTTIKYLVPGAVFVKTGHVFFDFSLHPSYQLPP
jgi:hypothetical protein